MISWGQAAVSLAQGLTHTMRNFPAPYLHMLHFDVGVHPHEERKMIHLTNRQARQFLLLKHGLLGAHRFKGKPGALAYVRQTGCIQFDPVDVCGKNPELVLQSRVKGFTKEMLETLLYADRRLFDYPDKNLSILPIEDWPYFERYRKVSRDGAAKFEGLTELEEQAKAYIREHGPVSADELPLTGKMHWHSHIHWSGNTSGESNAARSVLEQLYSTGDLVIHHKKGSRKCYDLADKHVSAAIRNAPDPLPDDFDHLTWRVLRRIGAVGLLWDKPSDAWLYIQGLKSPERNRIFARLLNEEKILAVQVEGLKDTLHCRSEDRPLIESVLQDVPMRSRCEFLAPLDCFLWDRKLIRSLFGFDYSWEIYTPPEKRKYSHYTLPVLYGEGFVGRIEAIVDRKTETLQVLNLWFEDGFRRTKKFSSSLEETIQRFAVFNRCLAVTQCKLLP